MVKNVSEVSGFNIVQLIKVIKQHVIILANFQACRYDISNLIFI